MKNKIQGYHISQGADTHFYILNDGDFFVKNLSTDLNTAILKAKEYTGQDVPVDIWLRSRQSAFHYEEKPKQHDAHIKSYENYLSIIEFEKKKAICDARQYIGSVGEKLNNELEMIDNFSFQSEYGISNCYKFKDKNDNRYIYFGSSSQLNIFKNKGDKFVVSFEIKKQFINNYKELIPYKINQITKIKATTEQIEFCWSYKYAKELEIKCINAEKKEDIKFNFYYDKKLFSCKKFTSFRKSKEFLYYLRDLLDNSKIEPNNLFIENFIDETVKSFYEELKK